MAWMGMTNDMNPTDWGWNEESRQLIDSSHDEDSKKNAAHDELLKVHCIVTV